MNPGSPSPDSRRYQQSGPFPSREQYLVLRAALDDGDSAIRAYRDWLGMVDIEQDFDREVFRLLPLLYTNLSRLGHRDALTGRLKGTYRMAWAKNHRLYDVSYTHLTLPTNREV